MILILIHSCLTNVGIGHLGSCAFRKDLICFTENDKCNWMLTFLTCYRCYRFAGLIKSVICYFPIGFYRGPPKKSKEHPLQFHYVVHPVIRFIAVGCFKLWFLWEAPMKFNRALALRIIQWIDLREIPLKIGLDGISL